MPHPFARRRALAAYRLYLLPIALLLCLTLPHLGQGEFSVDTGWYSAIALQAWRDAAHGHPGALWSLMGIGGQDGVPYFNKPPLAFWVHGFFLWAIGPTLFAARLPSVLAAAGCVTLTVATARRAAGPKVALLSGIVLATTPEFAHHARSFSLDMWNTLFLLGGLYFAAAAVRAQSPRRMLLAGLPIGLSLMTKPLLGLLALPMIALWLVVLSARRRDLQPLRRWMAGLFGASLIAIAVAAPWHVSMVLLHGDTFTNQYFGKEIAGRAAGQIAGLNRDAHQYEYYLRELTSRGWPWLATAALAALAIARRQRMGSRPGLASLAIVWALAWLALLTIFPDKRPRYLLPVYPAGAWLSGLWLAHAAPRWLARGRRWMERWSGPLLAAAALVIAVLPIRFEKPPAPQWTGLFSFLDGHGFRTPAKGQCEIWQGAFVGARAARVYLEYGRWPNPTHDNAGELIAHPPEGAFILYHRRDGWKPGDNETTIFQSGDITATELGPGGWGPILTPDPGE